MTMVIGSTPIVFAEIIKTSFGMIFIMAFTARLARDWIRHRAIGLDLTH